VRALLFVGAVEELRTSDQKKNIGSISGVAAQNAVARNCGPAGASNPSGCVISIED